MNLILLNWLRKVLRRTCSCRVEKLLQVATTRGVFFCFCIYSVYRELRNKLICAELTLQKGTGNESLGKYLSLLTWGQGRTDGLCGGTLTGIQWNLYKRNHCVGDFNSSDSLLRPGHTRSYYTYTRKLLFLLYQRTKKRKICQKGNYFIQY